MTNGQAHRLLVVDDKRDLAQGVALILRKLSSDIGVVYSAEEALQSIEQRPADLVLSDIRMPGRDGLSLLDTILEKWPQTRVILFTGYGTIESAVDAMKRGAYHYLTKPFNNDELILVAKRALKEIDDEAELVRLRAEVGRTNGFHGIFGRDKATLTVIDTIKRVATTSATVLIYGESGTGKELVAKAIHAESTRAQNKLVAFNAAALPETLAEAELFGCKKGAYTGADRDRKGLFQEANGGTLFIDELSSMPLSLQSKLLRVLQERVVTPLGSSNPVPIDVRVLASTNVDPRVLVRDRKLRQDLYFRLSVMRIVIPPLCERVEDIPILANLFLERLRSGGQSKKQLSARAIRLLISHDWPGNVRELQNVIERAAVIAHHDEIGPGDIVLEDDDLGWQPEPEQSVVYEEAKRRAIEKFQRRYVEELLGSSGGSISAAARRADMTRAALQRIVKRLGLSANDVDKDADVDSTENG